LSGLEATELKFSEVVNQSPTFRIDSDYFKKEFLSFSAGNNATNLRKLCIIRSGTTPPDRDDELTEGTILLKTTDIRNSVLSSGDTASLYRISPEIASRMQDTALRSLDVLINIVGATTEVIGRTAFIPSGFPDANITQAMALLRVKGKQLNPGLLFAYLAGEYGQKQVRRIARPTGQYNLNIPEVGSFKIPLPTKPFQDSVAELIHKANERLDASHALVSAAQLKLTDALGLSEWRPDPASVTTRNFSDALNAGRFDAEYFGPRYQSLLALLRRQGKTLRAVARLREDMFTPQPGQPFHYIEIGDLAADGAATSHVVPGEEAPSRATWIVQPGDVITSTVRPIRCLTGLVEPHQAGNICSSGFAVLTPKGIPGELLFAYLRLPVICELMDLHTTASMYPAISTTDLMRLPFLLPDDATVKKVKEQITAARAVRREAHALLEKAKRSVEVAIENNEATGMVILKG